LQDRKNGRVKPWKRKKVKTLIIADGLKNSGFEKRAERVKNCATFLEFRKDLETDAKHLVRANFCKAVLCPMCQWRKSLKVFTQVGKVMDAVSERRPELVPLFLTLTVRNCAVDKLSEALDELFEGFRRFLNVRRVERVIKGFFRALEITYNAKTDTFHPHIHMIVLVDKGYFKGREYMSTREWVEIWKKALNVDYGPVLDIRRCNTPTGERKHVAEVAKYTLKDDQYATSNSALTDRLVLSLSKALHKRMLVAFGGVMRAVARELGLSQPDKGDLVHIDDETVRGDVAHVIEQYRWHFGFADYAKVD
jgi:plasmid rolling circle replication initiator protein Rep